MAARLEGGEFPPRRGDVVRAHYVRKCHDAVGVADIERVAQQCHAERLIQSLHEGLAFFGDAVAIGVVQQRDAIGADAKGVGASHGGLHGVTKYAPDRFGDLRRLGNEDATIGPHMDPARMVQTGRKRIDLETGRRHRGLPVGPSFGHRHLERRQAALRLRRRHHRRAAPGRLRRDTLQPAPQDCDGTDQCNHSRKNARQAHGVPPVDGAHTIRRQSALKPPRYGPALCPAAIRWTMEEANPAAWWRRHAMKTRPARIGRCA